MNMFIMLRYEGLPQFEIIISIIELHHMLYNKQTQVKISIHANEYIYQLSNISGMPLWGIFILSIKI